MTPVGELVRYVVLARLARGPTPVEEIEALVRSAVDGRKFDWRIWPQLLAREVIIRDGVAELTERGRWLAAVGSKAMGSYIKKALGVDPDMMRPMRDREPVVIKLVSPRSACSISAAQPRL